MLRKELPKWGILLLVSGFLKPKETFYVILKITRQNL